MNVKELLLEQCIAYVKNRQKTIEETIHSHQKALSSETKSSAGDKHETGRAMLQLEMEKAGQQLSSVEQMNETLSKIDASKESKNGHLGALIQTTSGNYFLSISAGQIMTDQSIYFAISVSSPIGRLLLGKRKGEEIIFNGRKIKIKNIE